MAVWLLWREGCLGPVRNMMTVHVGSMPHASQLCWAVGDFVQHVRSVGVSLGQVLRQCARGGSRSEDGAVTGLRPRPAPETTPLATTVEPHRGL